MLYTVEQIARVCHEANRALQRAQADPAPSPAWDEAPDWQRESAVEGVDKALAGQGPEELHESWCEHKRADDWTYGPVKDAGAKTHPCLVPYDELPVGQIHKDELFAAIVDVLGRDARLLVADDVVAVEVDAPGFEVVRHDRGRTWFCNEGRLVVVGEHGVLVAEHAAGQWLKVKSCTGS